MKTGFIGKRIDGGGEVFGNFFYWTKRGINIPMIGMSIQNGSVNGFEVDPDSVEYQFKAPAGGEENGVTPVSMGIANGIDPCPLCKGKEGETVFLGYKHPYYRITCADCNLVITDDRKDKVQGKWNTRNGLGFFDRLKSPLPMMWRRWQKRG